MTNLKHSFHQIRHLSVLLLGALLSAAAAVTLGAATVPTFNTPQLVSTEAHVNSMVTGDFDKDGHGDVAVLDANNGHAEVRFGDGAGGYRATASNFTITSTNSTYLGIAAADLDGDGQAELVFAA